MKKFITVKELAEMLCVTESTIYNWAHGGYIPHLILKGSGKYNTIRFEEAEIENWLRLRSNETRRSSRIDRRARQDNLDSYDATSEEGR